MPRILYIEDNENLRESMKAWFRRLGYDFIALGDGAEAWELIQRDREFDLVISDNDLSGLNGKDLLEAMRAHEETRDIPFILISGLEPGSVFASIFQMDCEKWDARFYTKREFKVSEILPEIFSE